MRSIVATRLSIRLATSRCLKSVVNRDSISDRNTVGVVATLSSSRRAAWRTNFTLRHSPAATGLQFIDLSAASFRGRRRVGWRLSELFLREWLDETGGVSYFNPRCRDARTQIVRPQGAEAERSMIFCWKRSRLFAAFCRAARSMSGKFSIRSTGAAGHDVATDASNTHRRMARFDDLRISSTESWSGLGASPPSTRSCTSHWD